MSDRIVIFNHGRVEQIGSPREIYENPRSAFVSEFVGQTNRIQVQGKQVNIRPEHLTIAKTFAVGDRRLEGKLVDEIFVGASTRYLVETLDGTKLISTEKMDDSRVGDSVVISWKQEREFLVQ